MQVPIAFLVELNGRDERCIDIWFARHDTLQ
nr:MAG TPA: hypothetical protein [Caudoviricetes sp.]